MGNPRLGLQEGRGLLCPETGRSQVWPPRTPAHLLKAPAVRHGGDHLRELFLLTLQHTVHVLGRDLRADGRCGGHLWEPRAPQQGDEHLHSPHLLLSPHAIYP